MQASLKDATDIDTSMLASKIDFPGLKTEVDNLDVDKFKTISADLNKLNNMVDNDVIKRIAYDKLDIKGYAIDTKIQSTSGIATRNTV